MAMPMESFSIYDAAEPYTLGARDCSTLLLHNFASWLQCVELKKAFPKLEAKVSQSQSKAKTLLPSISAMAVSFSLPFGMSLGLSSRSVLNESEPVCSLPADAASAESLTREAEMAVPRINLQ